jgi:acyl carrier protein|tara:strand:+ start:71 stop:328 length:258 start_codon:yes stop_codon:yes gene_type:complete
MKKQLKIKEILIYKTIAKILKTSVSTLEKKDNLQSFKIWDSLVHLEIISKLDKILNGAITELSQVSSETSVNKIIKILKKKKLIH